MRAFLAVMRGGSLPEASRALGLSQSTIGRRIQRLETALGARLFDRLPNRLVPTPLGRELANPGAAMHDSVAAVARQASLSTDRPNASVRVTATGSISLFLAAHARVLAELAAKQGATVSLLTSKLPLDVADGAADIALRMRRLPGSGPLAARRVGQLAFTVYAARYYLRWRDCRVDWCDMDVIGLPETARSPSQSQWLDNAVRPRGAVIRLRFGDVALRYRAVQAGAGVSLLPCFLGDPDPDLVRLLDPPTELVEDVYLLLHEQRRARQAVRTVADALQQMFGQASDMLAGTVAAPDTVV
jgi:DNA-binding transcriptional LysR family regulator